MGLRAGMLAPALNGARGSRLCTPLLSDPPAGGLAGDALAAKLEEVLK